MSKQAILAFVIRVFMAVTHDGEEDWKSRGEVCSSPWLATVQFRA